MIDKNLLPHPDDFSCPPYDAMKTNSGISYKILIDNPNGKPVSPSDWVKVHYTGWDSTGKMFDSSEDGDGEPAVFPLLEILPGMSEAILLARTGERIRAWIPSKLAYDNMPGMPSGDLLFDFALIDIVTPVKPPTTPTEDAVDLGDGIFMQLLERGDGKETVGLRDVARFDFVVWTPEEKKYVTSSNDHGEPLHAPVRSLCPALRIPLLHAHKGDRIRVWTPQEQGIDPDGLDFEGPLIMEIHLYDFARGLDAIEAPDDVAEPPSDAQKFPSGLAKKLLSAGNGAKPNPQSTVRVHYTGWTTDGDMFDSSIARGEPAMFSLKNVIPGWTEALTTMQEGERARFWIPEDLAYAGMPGMPQGMLVFDIDFIAIL